MSEELVETEHRREDADEFCLTPEAADRLVGGAPWRRFVVLGDSLAEGLGDPTPGYRTLAWTDRVAEALRRQQPDLVLTNLGKRALRTAEVRATQLDAARALKPDLAALVCGGNDLFAVDFDPEAIEGELDAIVSGLQDEGATVAIFALQNISLAFPQLAGIRSQMLTLNERIRAVAARRDALLIDMWGHPVCGSTDVYSSDLMHSSMRGHAVLASEMIRRLGAHLASVHEGAAGRDRSGG